MAEPHLDAASIGPTIDLSDVHLPEAVATGLATLYGTADPIRDAAAWVAANREAVRMAEGRAPTVEDLCTTPDGAHVFQPATGGDGQAYVCVLDPLLYPVLTDTPGTVRSVTPVRETTISMAVTAEGIDVSAPDAVVSIGVADDVDDAQPSLETVYRQVCAYVHVFADEVEYETWAASVDAATTAVPVETGVGLATALAEAMFD